MPAEVIITVELNTCRILSKTKSILSYSGSFYRLSLTSSSRYLCGNALLIWSSQDACACQRAAQLTARLIFPLKTMTPLTIQRCGRKFRETIFIAEALAHDAEGICDVSHERTNKSVFHFHQNCRRAFVLTRCGFFARRHLCVLASLPRVKSFRTAARETLKCTSVAADVQVMT